MFRLFSKKQDNEIVTETNSQQTDNNSSLDVIFNIISSPLVNKKGKVYLYEWLKNDGDWVEEGQPLYSIVQFEEGSGEISDAWQLVAKKNGIVQLLKKKDELIQEGDKIYTIHPKGKYSLENTPSKESFNFYFDNFKYSIQENSYNFFEIKEWNKQDGELVKQGEIILTINCDTTRYNKIINHYAEKDGYIDKVKTRPGINSLHQNELIYIIHEKDEYRIKRKFINTSEIIIDDFTCKKIIKWKQVGNNDEYSTGITSKSVDNKISFTFSFNNIDEKDFIIFQFYSKEIMLSKEDVVSFLFTDNRIISFIIKSSSYKAYHPYIEKLFENKVQITDDELQHFEMQQFLKWKIILKKQNQEIIGGNEGSYQYQTHKNLTIVINKFAKEYRELVRSEIPNYMPLLQRDTLLISNENIVSEECYVYLMIDTNNHYNKIGISNKPEWREKTLQSEKPTIELLAYKKFVSRKMASSFEKALHDTYANKRIRGEWFQLDTKDIEEIKITLTT